jgi:hypothetical protein
MNPTIYNLIIQYNSKINESIILLFKININQKMNELKTGLYTIKLKQAEHTKTVRFSKL